MSSEYLEKLGLDETVPLTAGGLAILQTAHVQQVPYSTIDHFCGDVASIEPERIVKRIVDIGYAGCCFELNSAFGGLLRELGFDARQHPAHIFRDREPALSSVDTPLVTNHLAITVHGLPSADNPEGVWLTDVGLGDGPYRPLPLQVGSHQEGSFEYALENTPESGEWRFLHHPLGSFIGMSFDSTIEMDTESLNTAHQALIFRPTSRLVRNLIVERRPDTRLALDAVDTLVNCELQRRHGRVLGIEEITDKSLWFSMLEQIFGLSLDEYTDDQKSSLWRRVLAAHNQRKQAAQ